MRTVSPLDVLRVLQRYDILACESFVRHKVMPVARFDVEAIYRFSSVYVAGGANGDQMSVLIERLERDRVMINSFSIPTEVQSNEVARCELLTRYWICSMLSDEWDNGQQVVGGSICRAYRSVERFECQSTAVEWQTCERMRST